MVVKNNSYWITFLALIIVLVLMCSVEIEGRSGRLGCLTVRFRSKRCKNKKTKPETIETKQQIQHRLFQQVFFRQTRSADKNLVDEDDFDEVIRQIDTHF